jgi:hypothetical protein
MRFDFTDPFWTPPRPPMVTTPERTVARVEAIER